MTYILPTWWAYEAIPDHLARLGSDTTLVVRATADGYTVLGVFPGPELAERFLEALIQAPRESLFNAPVKLSAPLLNPPAPAPDPPAPRRTPHRG